MELPLLQELVVIFCLSILVIYACHKVKIPPIVGFLLTGVVCGPYGLKLVSAVHEVEILAEVGVVLLMFSIGMELSVSELVRLRKPVFLGGGLQVALTAAVVLPLALLFGHQWNQALFVGFFVALSSTAIILKILGSQFTFTDKNEARSWFNRLRQRFLDYNGTEWESEQFKALQKELEAAVAERSQGVDKAAEQFLA